MLTPYCAQLFIVKKKTKKTGIFFFARLILQELQREYFHLHFTREENENRELKPLCGYIVIKWLSRAQGSWVSPRRNRKENNEGGAALFLGSRPWEQV